ncbi:hypothetical protein K4K54_002777 [Colletotrichum sp. SAR 10_86]|nr:hypothetical protein K4K54_002777 [Colletotrichum sp. SAR 10_86]KAI8228787.1 hypothetical protein K4K53_005682 [Colletotrichum sp. SAR 10_77]
MKVSILSLTTLLAAVAVAQKPVTEDEANAWQSCTWALLDKFNKGDDGSKAACDLWGCLQLMSSRYHRGGGLTQSAAEMGHVPASLRNYGRTLSGWPQHPGEQQAWLTLKVQNEKPAGLVETCG